MVNTTEANVYAEFLERSEDERFEYLTGTKLHWWQKLYIKFLNKWWTSMRRDNPGIAAHILWESIIKGRF